MAEVRACRLCTSDRLAMVLDLGSQPLAERDDGNIYPLAVVRCLQCGLHQLTFRVAKQEVFPPDHPYSTGNTRALREHFRGLAEEVAPLLEPGGLIVDIGANDGTFLAAVRDAAPAARVLGVEPTRQGDRCLARGIPACREFFSEGLALDIRAMHGAAAVVTASNVLAHVPEPHDFIRGVRAVLAPGGTFITENHDWASVEDGLQVDAVYHEHLRYWTPATVCRLLEGKHGFRVRSMTSIPVHGGSFRVTATCQPHMPPLSVRADATRVRLREVLAGCVRAGPVYGVGAATRATPLIHWAGLADFITCVCEVPGSDKVGMTMPGTSIPVVDEEKLIADQPPHALLFCWHIADSVVPKLRAAGYGGRFIIPLPHAGVLDG